MIVEDRNIIFLSHATHQDDYFASWLAAKLRMLGYNVWLDIDDIRGGDSFYTKIQPIIQKEARKFIAITTKTYVNKSQDQNSGVTKELNCASTIRDIDNFILPIKVDDVEYDDFPMHYNGRDTINFYGNWQTGLISLVNDLEKCSIAKNTIIKDPRADWFKVIQNNEVVLERDEKYHTNWFGVELPKYVYINEPKILDEREYYGIPFPFILESKRIISFFNADTVNMFTDNNISFQVNIEEFFTEDDLVINDNITIKDPSKKLIKLLNKCFYHHLNEKDLICWKKGKKKKRKIFYFKHHGDQKSISLKRYGKPRGRRSLTGRNTETINNEKCDVYWHYAINPSAGLKPLPHFKLFYSVVFSDKNFIRFDKKLQQQFRRSIPSDWYNRKWQEMLLASMLKLSKTEDSEKIEIEIDFNTFLRVNNEPFFATSSVGYLEPEND